MTIGEKTYWVRCPVCNKKTRTKVFKSTVLIDFPLYCPRCEEQFKVNIVELKLVVIS